MTVAQANKDTSSLARARQVYTVLASGGNHSTCRTCASSELRGAGLWCTRGFFDVVPNATCMAQVDRSAAAKVRIGPGDV